MKTIGNYIYKTDYIGKGSFSKVYIGNKQDNENFKVAVKKIYKKEDIKYRKYIEKEIEIMYKLNHKNIIKLYDTIETEKHIFLILELCDTDLYKFINKNKLTETEIQYIIRQIIEAIKYIMDNNIVHRDLKPHNILINKNMEIKLADFGFAREFKETLLSDTVCGSPLYMAPEILNNHKYNIKSDIWSIGIIMYEMVMKNHPFKANNMTDLITKINNKKPLLFDTNISPKCKDLITNLLVIDYKKRLDWDDIFKNEWIYNKIEIETKKELNYNIKKEDSFDYCFDNSIDEIEEDIENKINGENINEDYFQIKIDEKLQLCKAKPINIKNSINIRNNVVNDYIIVNKPNTNSIETIMNNSLEYFKKIFKN